MMDNGEKKSSDFKDYLALGPVFKYFFRRRNPERKQNLSLKVMHGINKFSIIIFLLAIIYLVLKYIF